MVPPKQGLEIAHGFQAQAHELERAPLASREPAAA
jgi:hypothetical protein